MRFVQAVLLLAFLGAVAVFAFQNTQVVTVRLLNSSVTAPVALTVGAGYVLGMLSGWTVVAFVGQSIQRIRNPDR
jgi:lipopolysaccharide assembly protein A